MELLINSDFTFTTYHYQSDGTTALNLGNFSQVVATLLDADGDEIVSYTYSASTGNFVGTGTTGEALLKFDHADNVDDYIGDVTLQFSYRTTDAAFAAGYSELKTTPVLLMTIVTEKPNP